MDVVMDVNCDLIREAWLDFTIPIGLINGDADWYTPLSTVEEYYEESGEGPIVKYTNKAGAENMNANPALTLWDKLNATALTYWRELGLTPSGYKKVKGEKPKETQALSGLAAALASIES